MFFAGFIVGLVVGLFGAAVLYWRNRKQIAALTAKVEELNLMRDLGSDGGKEN